ncbi:hypothetical protein NTCA1_50520 [Novosphingobium sp. TCA1]|nr:hypothetical protein NTCA1_50520 [Novosphingobium sp. TCA1]
MKYTGISQGLYEYYEDIGQAEYPEFCWNKESCGEEGHDKRRKLLQRSCREGEKGQATAGSGIA